MLCDSMNLLVIFEVFINFNLFILFNLFMMLYICLLLRLKLSSFLSFLMAGVIMEKGYEELRLHEISTVIKEKDLPVLILGIAIRQVRFTSIVSLMSSLFLLKLLPCYCCGLKLFLGFYALKFPPWGRSVCNSASYVP